jgi:hypothetical protein
MDCLLNFSGKLFCPKIILPLIYKYFLNADHRSKIRRLTIYTQAEMVFGYYHRHPKTLTLTLSSGERE